MFILYMIMQLQIKLTYLLRYHVILCASVATGNDALTQLLLFQVTRYTVLRFTSHVNANVSGLQQRHTCERNICVSWILLILPTL